MESVTGGDEATREEGKGVAGWIAQNLSRLRHRWRGTAAAWAVSVPAASSSPEAGNSLDAADHPSSSALSTETIRIPWHEHVRSLLIGACILVAGFLFGAAVTAERSKPIKYQAVAVEGDTPLRPLRRLDMCEANLVQARVTVDEISQAAGVAAVQLSQCLGGKGQ